MSTITPVKSLVAIAKSETKAVTPQQAFDQLQAGTAILIDIRDIRELQREGQIDGAFHAPAACSNSGQTRKAPITKTCLLNLAI